MSRRGGHVQRGRYPHRSPISRTWIPWDMVDKRAVRMLLECFLVVEEHLHLKLQL